MIVPLVDSVSGAAVYFNPDYVVSLRPDPMKRRLGDDLSELADEALRPVGGRRAATCRTYPFTRPTWRRKTMRRRTRWT